MKAKDLHYKRLKREGPTIAAQQPFLFGNAPNLYQMEAGAAVQGTIMVMIRGYYTLPIRNTSQQIACQKPF